MFVSSGNMMILTEFPVQLIISLTYITKNKGPNTLPCGTPVVISISDEEHWLSKKILLLPIA